MGLYSTAIPGIREAICVSDELVHTDFDGLIFALDIICRLISIHAETEKYHAFTFFGRCMLLSL